MPDQIIIWAILCLSVATVLFLVELFVPSGGLLGVLSTAALIGGVVLLFMYDTTVGLWGAAAVLALMPVMLVMAIKIWPHTPIARMLTLRSGRASDGLETGDEPSQAGPTPTSATAIVGATGKAITALRPIGTCLINGKRVDCWADGAMIAPGTPVRVTFADGMQIRVQADDAV